MESMHKEKLLEKYPVPVTLECTKKIIDQMQYSICKINNKCGRGTGFFCYIPYEKTKIPVMITNNHIINEEIIKNNKIIRVTLNDDKQYIDIKLDNKRKIYTNIKDDITIIEIKDEKKEIKEFLEIDPNIFKNNINLFNENIYLLQYPKYLHMQIASVSYGFLREINNNSDIILSCSTESGSSGSPILNISNNKVIGIHKESSSTYNYNKGIILRIPIDGFIKKNDLIDVNNKDESLKTPMDECVDNNKKKDNEIKMKLKIGKNDINEDIYFLDNTDGYYGRIPNMSFPKMSVLKIL